jgi:hypothetical protein
MSVKNIHSSYLLTLPYNIERFKFMLQVNKQIAVTATKRNVLNRQLNVVRVGNPACLIQQSWRRALEFSMYCLHCQLVYSTTALARFHITSS